jgi:hypothetical protein
MAGLEGFAGTRFRQDEAVNFSGRLIAIVCLMGTLAIALLLMTFPIKLPMGAFYWDVYLFQDAASRIASGQVAHQDFFLPVGALPYYLYALANEVFVVGHPLLVAQYAMLVLAVPLMAAAVAASDRSSAFLIAATLPFALFALLPVNTIEFAASPAVDGAGVYNRQAALLLYALVFTLVAVPRGLALGAIAGLLLALLFFVKINGFVVGVGFAVLAAISGRLGYRSIAVMLAAVLVPIIATQMWSGLVSRYVADILSMLGHNQSGTARRLLWLVGAKFDVILGLFALILLVAYYQRGALGSHLGGLWRRPGTATFFAFIGEPAVQLGGAVTLALLFELQNTGSHEFIYLWPVLLAIFSLASGQGDRLRTIVLAGAIALSMAPTLTKTLHRAAEAIATIPRSEEIPLPQLEPINHAVARSQVIARAQRMLGHFGESVDFTQSLAEMGLEPGSLYYATPDFQALLLFEIADAVDALERYEARTGHRFESLAGLDFVDVLPLVMKRKPVDGIVMGLDPERGFPTAHRASYLQGLSQVEAILQPLCPVTPQRLQLMKIVEPVLSGRTSIDLTPCWRLFVESGTATPDIGGNEG